jgi:hypothetical protein
LAFFAAAMWPSRSLAVVAPHLRDLTKAARLVVVANVESVTAYDQGRVEVANLRIETVLKGSLGSEPGSVRVVERRDLPTPPRFRQGQAIVAFLEAAPRSSSLNAILPKGLYYSLAESWRPSSPRVETRVPIPRNTPSQLASWLSSFWRRAIPSSWTMAQRA